MQYIHLVLPMSNALDVNTYMKLSDLLSRSDLTTVKLLYQLPVDLVPGEVLALMIGLLANIDELNCTPSCEPPTGYTNPSYAIKYLLHWSESTVSTLLSTCCAIMNWLEFQYCMPAHYREGLGVLGGCTTDSLNDHITERSLLHIRGGQYLNSVQLLSQFGHHSIHATLHNLDIYANTAQYYDPIMKPADMDGVAVLSIDRSTAVIEILHTVLMGSATTTVHSALLGVLTGNTHQMRGIFSPISTDSVLTCSSWKDEIWCIIRQYLVHIIYYYCRQLYPPAYSTNSQHALYDHIHGLFNSGVSRPKLTNEMTSEKEWIADNLWLQQAVSLLYSSLLSVFNVYMHSDTLTATDRLEIALLDYIIKSVYLKHSDIKTLLLDELHMGTCNGANISLALQFKMILCRHVCLNAKRASKVSLFNMQLITSSTVYRQLLVYIMEGIQQYYTPLIHNDSDLGTSMNIDQFISILSTFISFIHDVKHQVSCYSILFIYMHAIYLQHIDNVIVDGTGKDITNLSVYISIQSNYDTQHPLFNRLFEYLSTQLDTLAYFVLQATIYRYISSISVQDNQLDYYSNIYCQVYQYIDTLHGNVSNEDETANDMPQDSVLNYTHPYHRHIDRPCIDQIGTENDSVQFVNALFFTLCLSRCTPVPQLLSVLNVAFGQLECMVTRCALPVLDGTLVVPAVVATEASLLCLAQCILKIAQKGLAASLGGSLCGLGYGRVCEFWRSAVLVVALRAELRRYLRCIGDAAPPVRTAALRSNAAQIGREMRRHCATALDLAPWARPPPALLGRLLTAAVDAAASGVAHATTALHAEYFAPSFQLLNKLRGIKFIAYSQSTVNALDNQGVANAFDNQGVANGLNNQGVANALDNQGVANALDNQGVANGLNNQGVANGLNNQGVANGLDNQGVANALDNQG